jgi:hypothetical protein
MREAVVGLQAGPRGRAGGLLGVPTDCAAVAITWRRQRELQAVQPSLTARDASGA